MNAPILSTTFILYQLLNFDRKLQLLGLCIYSSIVAILESVSIGAIYPILEIIAGKTDAEDIFGYEHVLRISEYTPFDLSIEQVYVSLFILIALTSSIAKILALKVNGYYSAIAGSDISLKLYRSFFNKKNVFFINNDTSKLVSSLIDGTAHILQAINACLTIFAGFVTSIATLSVLLLMEPRMTLFVGITLLIFYTVSTLVLEKYQSESGNLMVKCDTDLHKIVRETLLTRREIMMYGMEDKFGRQFKNYDLRKRCAVATSQFNSAFPKYVIEFIVIATILSTAIFGHSSSNAIQSLGLFAFGAQRLIPSFQQIFASVNRVTAITPSINRVNNLINLDSLNHNSFVNERNKPIELNNKSTIKIDFADIAYKLPESNKYLFRDLSFQITNGDFVAITGPSGSGKSTLLDLIMGYKDIEDGNIKLNSKPLVIDHFVQMNHICSYVPQRISVFNNSILYNITLRDKKFITDTDIKFVNEILESVHLASFVHTLPQGIDTYVGDSGALLSGGQCQRLALARSLFQNRPILILDEATTGLSSEMECSILRKISEVYSQRICLFISHNNQTRSIANKVINL